MKVLMINGSRREHGCTYTALQKMAEVFAEAGVESEIIFVGKRAVNGEIDELVKEIAGAAATADGIVVGSPVYYASPTGEVLSVLDRLFSVAEADLRFKPAAAVTSARRAGTTACLDALNKYFMFNQMPIVSSRYWNMVHGSVPEDVKKDEEGLQIMEVLAKNMIWLMQSIAAGKEKGVVQPQPVKKVLTNFIR
jgi:multimeric flavodoxin WrbA